MPPDPPSLAQKGPPFPPQQPTQTKIWLRPWETVTFEWTITNLTGHFSFSFTAN